MLEMLIFLGKQVLRESLPIVAVTHLLLPIGFILWLGLVENKTKLNWLVKLVLFGTYLVWFLIAGRWSLISIYLRLLLPLFFLAAVVFSYLKVQDVPFLEQDNWISWFIAGLSFAAWLLLVLLTVITLRGYSYSGNPVKLSFPLKKGIYYVINGGSTSILNNYRANGFYQQKKVIHSLQFAVDVEKLSVWGTNAEEIFPKELGSYPIYSEAVYSPCAGKVIALNNEEPDLIPPQNNWVNWNGNKVVIKHGGILVTVSHLMNKSIRVKIGDLVKAGELIGRIGNSGLSNRPHLHIYASRNIWGDGVPLEFTGSFPVRNNLIIIK